MKKILIILSIILIFISISAIEFEEQNSQEQYFKHHSLSNESNIQITLENEKLDIQTIRSTVNTDYTFSKTYALPYQEAEIEIESITFEDYDHEGHLLQNKSYPNNNFAKISNQFTFKEMRGFTVHFNPVFVNEEGYTLVKSANIRINGRQRISVPNEISEAFLPLYENLAANFRDSYLHDSNIKKPSMLIISHNALSNDLTSYIRWRKACGFDVHVITKENIATNPSNTQIKSAIQDYYNQAENKPDYLMLIGDSNQNSYYKLPTFYVTAPSYPEICATDLDYALLEGTDYFPEMLVGRLCIDSNSEMKIILNKTIRYERIPASNTNQWQEKALVVAGNYASGNLIPTTPVDMSRWIYEKIASHGYTQVDTVFYQDGAGTPPEYMTTQIMNSLNNGVQYVSYRGWGSGNGWQYPLFYRNHLGATNNHGATPIVYSIVCDTGDFDHQSYDPCFGEVWMTKGTEAEPDGAVAFVGPSFLNTSTPLNNSISSGMFRSVFDENARIFGTTVMRGKLELYNNFPNNQNTGDNVPFYFQIYNMLSDPSLSMWKLQPWTINHNLPNSINQSTNYIEVSVPNITHGYVTATKNENDYTYARIINGYAILPIDNNLTGNVKVTITAKNYLPVVKTITVNSDELIGVTAYQIENSSFYSGVSSDLTISLKNFSSQTINNATITLSTNSDYATINEPTYILSTIASGATVSFSKNVSISPSCPDQTQLSFTVNINSGQSISKFSTVVGGLVFQISNPIVTSNGGIINPGESRTIQFTVHNLSAIPTNNLNAVITPLSNAVTCSQTPFAVNNMIAGGSTDITFDLSVANDCFVGRNVRFFVDFTSDNGFNNRQYFDLVIGNPTNTSVTGPDQFGYFAYDSNDATYPERPVYNWIEIDPDLAGGNATQVLMADDSSVNINLPFTFKYYGLDYNELTICSNGWISLGDTWQNDFSNWNIPSALGPYAMIAPYWDDLKGYKTSDTTWDPMHVCYLWDNTNQRFIVEWNDTYNAFNNTSLEKFQVILYPLANQNGEIVFQYHTIDNPASNNNFATVGIENHTQTDGIAYTFGNLYPVTASPLTANLAVKFTTSAPDSYVSNDNPDISNKIVKLQQNYPNPFNPNTQISFEIPETDHLSLIIYNAKGQKVKTLINQTISKGIHKVNWDGSDDNNHQVSSGIYFYRLQYQKSDQMKKMLMIK